MSQSHSFVQNICIKKKVIEFKTRATVAIHPLPYLEGGLGSRLEPLWPDPPFPLWRGGGGAGFETRATMARATMARATMARPPLPSLEGGLGSRLEPL